MPENTLPKISVVIPSFNCAEYLAATIDSVLDQDYPDLECIVVDAASSDDTLQLLRRYEGRISWISEPDRGAFDAINKGWALSRGSVLAWLNADDIWEQGAASIVGDYFRDHPDTDILYGDCGGIDERGRLVEVYPARRWDFVGAVRACDHIINQAASFVRREAIEKVGGLYPAWCHDHDLWLRLAAAGCQFDAVHSQLASARLRDANLGNNPSIVIPAKLGLTRRVFELPNLPPEIRRIERRATSNAFVRGLDYVRPSDRSHWRWGIYCFFGAIFADPMNFPSAIAACVRKALWPARHWGPAFARKVTNPLARIARAVEGTGRSAHWAASRLRPWVGVVLLAAVVWELRRLRKDMSHK